MTTKGNNIFFTVMLLSPPLLTLVLWLVMGFPEQEEITVSVYYMQLLMIALTLTSVPLLLRFVTSERCGARYLALCIARLSTFEALSWANILLYYFVCPSPTFFYLGVIMWLAMFFAKPKTVR